MTARTKKSNAIKILTVTGIMAGLASVLMYFDFPLVIFFPDFLKLDFSDFPALITAFLFGPIYGVAVELIKNVIHMPVSSTGFSGELANFCVGSAFVFTAGVIYRANKRLLNALLAMIMGTVSMIYMGIIVNYLIIIPYYVTVKNFPLEAIIGLCKKFVPFIDSKLDMVLFTMGPFNLIKGIMISFVTMLIYKRISVLIRHFGVK